MTSRRFLFILGLLLISFGVNARASAEPLRIVAIGASNTRGWGVNPGEAFPERLQELLRAKGIDATVINAGVDFDTTRDMLKRFDRAVPNGTQIVIVEPGRNDLHFFSTWEKRAARLREMVRRIEARGMKAIVYEPAYAEDDFQWDRFHLTPKAHEKVAADLSTKVVALTGKPEKPAIRQPPKKR